ncbi:conserved hypothetical protein [Ricinus communis]|uniref:Uncharacterized protein n=1 Tax=Ricinus communis TaxID=3988 RepID=B9SU39_RICCO|nr:conserved hypothetical protein [Ricinus communis]
MLLSIDGTLLIIDFNSECKRPPSPVVLIVASSSSLEVHHVVHYLPFVTHVRSKKEKVAVAMLLNG